MPQIRNLIKYKPGTLEFAPCGPYNQLCYLAHCHRCTTNNSELFAISTAWS